MHSENDDRAGWFARALAPSGERGAQALTEPLASPADRSITTTSPSTSAGYWTIALRLRAKAHNSDTIIETHASKVCEPMRACRARAKTPAGKIHAASADRRRGPVGYLGHVLMENRNGLVVDSRLTFATGKAAREAALEMVGKLSGQSRVTLGADKGYDTADFVADLRKLNVTRMWRRIYLAAKRNRRSDDNAPRRLRN